MTNDNMSVYCRQCWSFAAAFMSTANILIKALQPWPFDRLDRTTGCSWTICCRTCLRGTICPVPVVALGQLCWLLPAKLGSGMGRTVGISTVVGVPFLGPLGNPTPIWVNYNISLTWIKAIWGWFPILTIIPVRSQWGRYNLPRPMHLFGIRRNPLEDPPKDPPANRSCSASAETPMSRFNLAKSSFPRSLSTWLPRGLSFNRFLHDGSKNDSSQRISEVESCEKSCLLSANIYK